MMEIHAAAMMEMTWGIHAAAMMEMACGIHAAAMMEVTGVIHTTAMEMTRGIYIYDAYDCDDLDPYIYMKLYDGLD